MVNDQRILRVNSIESEILYAESVLPKVTKGKPYCGGVRECHGFFFFN